MSRPFINYRRMPRCDCTVPDCSRGGIIQAGDKIVCNRHYQMWRKYGAFENPVRIRSRDCICAECTNPFDMGYAVAKGARKNVFCSDECNKSFVRKTAKANELARFWKFVEVRSETECWTWKGQLNEHGYGCFNRTGGGSPLANRTSLEFSLGRPIAHGMLSCHTCDNPPCVNPSHLYEGTKKSNWEDYNTRGKSKKAGASA